MNPKSLALLFAITGSVLISFSAVFVTNSQHGPAVTGFYRMIFASGIFALLAIGRSESWPTYNKGLLRLISVGLFFALDLTLWHRCIPYLGVGLATLLNNFQVFFVFIFAAVLGDTPFTRKKTLIVFAASLGLLLSWHGELSSSPFFYHGIFWGLASAACYSGSLINLHKLSVSRDFGEFAKLAVMSISAAAFLLVEGLINTEDFGFYSWHDAITLTGYSLSSQVLAWFLITISMKKLDASTISLSLLIQPCFSYAWDLIFYGKVLNIYEFLGVGVILLCIWKGKTD